MAILLIMMAAVLWGVAGAGAKGLYASALTPLVLTAVRSWVAGGVLIVPLLRRRQALHVRPLAWRWILALGCMLALVNFTYYLAISYIPVSVAIVMQYTAPLWIVGWNAAVRGVVVPRRTWWLVAASVVSCAALVGMHRIGAAQLNWPGLVIALLSAWAFAACTVCGQRVHAAGVTSTQSVALAFVVASAIWLVVLLAAGQIHILTQPLPWLGMIAVGLFGTAVPFTLYLRGLERVAPFVATMIGMLEVLTASLVAWAWLGESLDALQIAGMIGVGVCVGLVSRGGPPCPLANE